jgi:hypothetical protein
MTSDDLNREPVPSSARLRFGTWFVTWLGIGLGFFLPTFRSIGGEAWGYLSGALFMGVAGGLAYNRLWRWHSEAKGIAPSAVRAVLYGFVAGVPYAVYDAISTGIVTQWAQKIPILDVAAVVAAGGTGGLSWVVSKLTSSHQSPTMLR